MEAHAFEAGAALGGREGVAVEARRVDRLTGLVWEHQRIVITLPDRGHVRGHFVSEERRDRQTTSSGASLGLRPPWLPAYPRDLLYDGDASSKHVDVPQL